MKVTADDCPHCGERRHKGGRGWHRYTVRLRYYDDTGEGVEMRVCGQNSHDAAERAAERWDGCSRFDAAADLLVVVCDGHARLRRYRVKPELVFCALEEAL